MNWLDIWKFKTQYDVNDPFSTEYDITEDLKDIGLILGEDFTMASWGTGDNKHYSFLAYNQNAMQSICEFLGVES